MRVGDKVKVIYDVRLRCQDGSVQWVDSETYATITAIHPSMELVQINNICWWVSIYNFSTLPQFYPFKKYRRSLP